MLHLTKVALGVSSLDQLQDRFDRLAGDGPAFITTRYMPKRAEEIAGKGSLFWIVKHQLVARSPIIGFGEAEGGRVAFHLERGLIRVASRTKKAHQGWRYLEDGDAPPDLGMAGDVLSDMPPAMLARLSALSLV